MSSAKDLHRLMRNIGAQTGGQASVEAIDWDDGQIESFKLTLRPNSGFFKGGTFEFRIAFGKNYPSTDPPTVECLTDILHPNMNTCDCEEPTNVCINLLESGTWNPKFGLESIVLGLLFLLSNPNFNSPLVDCFENCEFQDGEDTSERFGYMVHQYMRGEEVEGNIMMHSFSVMLKAKQIGRIGLSAIVQRTKFKMDVMSHS